MSSTHLLLIALGHCAHSAWEWFTDVCSLMGEGLRQFGAGVTGWDGEE